MCFLLELLIGAFCLATGGSLSRVAENGAIAQGKRMETGRQGDPKSSFLPWDEAVSVTLLGFLVG